MSQENVEVVRRLYEAIGRHDSEGVLALYDPYVVCDYSRVGWGDLTKGGVYYGHEGLRTVYREWYEAWEDYEEVLEEVIDARDRVVSVVTGRARGRASGVAVENAHHAGVWTIQDGRIIRVVWFPSRHEALEATGLKENQ
jgi:ketosteroid isomerase-like protein